MRCRRCRYEWHQEPVAEDAAAPAARRRTGRPAAPAAAPAAAVPPPTPSPPPAAAHPPAAAAPPAFDPEETRDDAVAELSRLSVQTGPAEREMDDAPYDGGDRAAPIGRRAGRRAVRPPLWRRRPVQWAALGLVAAALGGAVVAFPGAVVGSWPAAARLYAVIGLPVPVPGAGLALESVHARAEPVAGGAIRLVVEGRIVNRSDRLIAVPQVRVLALDAGGGAVDRWEVPADPSLLLPGEISTFQTDRTGDRVPTQVAVTFVGGPGPDHPGFPMPDDAAPGGPAPDPTPAAPASG